MANTIATTNRPNVFSVDFLKIMMRGTGQVMFQNNVWTGIFFMIGIFWGAYWEGLGLVAWGALVGVAVSTITGYLLKMPARDGAQGLWGFNGVLVGCAFPTFMGNTIWMWLALILCAALTTWVRTGFNNVMAPWKVNSFTFPFVFCTWMFLLAARAMHGLPTTHMGDPALPAAFSAAENIGFGHLIVYWLKGIAQVFLIDNWVTGILFLIGLGISNRWAALWAAIGSALALFVALIFKASGAAIANGLYGFSAVLTAIALATVFYKPNARSAVWAILGILVTLFIQAGMNILLEPVGIATLTGPFCVATWLFLLPGIKFDDVEKPDHSNWDPENKTHLAAAEVGPLKPASGADLKTGAEPKTGGKASSDRNPKQEMRRNRQPDDRQDARRGPQQDSGQNAKQDARQNQQRGNGPDAPQSQRGNGQAERPDPQQDERPAPQQHVRSADSAPKNTAGRQPDAQSAPDSSTDTEPNR